MKRFIYVIFALLLCAYPGYAQADTVWGSTNASAQTTQIRIGVDISAAGVPSYFSLIPSISDGVFFNNSGSMENDTGFTYDPTGNDLSVPDNVEADGFCDEAGANCFAPEDVATAANTVTFTGKTFDANASGNNLSNVETADIASGSKSGSDATLITGTAGTSGVPAEWNADGDIVDATDTYTVAGKETLWVPAGAMIPATTSGPAAATLETATNVINIDVLDFDTSADEHAHFNVGFPKSWDLGTVTFQIFWTATTGGTTGVAFALQGVSLADNVSLDTAYGTAIVVTDDAQTGALELYVSAESAAVTISETPADDDLVQFRLFRDVSDGNDDLAEDARLIGIKFFFNTDAKDDT